MKKLVLLVLAMTVLAFTGCGEKKDAGKSEDGKVEIRFGWWGGSSRHNATLKALELFEKKYPNITVKAEYTGWTGYNEKQTTQIIGNTAPDLMQVNWNMLFELGADNFLNLKDTNIDLSNFPDSALNLVSADDKVMGIPLGMSGKVFYYQKNIYEKAGLELPKSFADLTAAAKVFKEKLGEDYYPLYADDSAGFYLILYYLEQKTGKPFITGDKVNYTVDEMEDGFNFFLSLVDDGVIPSIAETQSGGVVPFSQNPNWINGKYAALYEWDTSGGKVEKSVAEGSVVVVGESPKDYGKPALMNKVSMTWAINAKTKHKEETELLLNFLLTDSEAVQALGVQRGIPLNKVTSGILKDADMLKGIQYEGHKVKMKDSGLGLSPYFESGELKTYYKNIMQEVDTDKNSRVVAEKVINKVNEFLPTKIK